MIQSLMSGDSSEGGVGTAGSGEMRNPVVLAVGHVCLDIVSFCIRYPEEDSDVGSNSKIEKLSSEGNRCTEQRCERGGNAANTATVLATLGCSVDFLGSIPRGPFLQFLREDFASANIGITNCVEFDADAPISSIVVSQTTATRTIIHNNRNLPEVSLEHLIAATRKRRYDWIHFEGRNVETVCEMIDHIRRESPETRVSVEVERPGRLNIIRLMQIADVAFISKEFARSHGFFTMEDAVRGLADKLKPSSILFCAWGELGAAAIDNNSGTVATSISFPPSSIVDTLGAGDTFNAAAIWSLSRQLTLDQTLKMACRVSGAKIGVKGFKPLGQVLREESIL